MTAATDNPGHKYPDPKSFKDHYFIVLRAGNPWEITSYLTKYNTLDPNRDNALVVESYDIALKLLKHAKTLKLASRKLLHVHVVNGPNQF